MAGLKRLGQTWRTVRHMPLEQPLRRIVLRSRLAIERRSAVIAGWNLRGERPSGTFWPAGYVPCDGRALAQWPSANEVVLGQLVVLGRPVDLQGGGFRDACHPQLVGYHVQYWDWAWALKSLAPGDGRVAFARLFELWSRDVEFPHGNTWSPYVVSLRAWAWCSQYEYLIRGGPVECQVLEQLWLHLGYVRNHLERDVGGNHLLKNLKAWLGLAVFFGIEEDISRAANEIERQVRKQVLPDGGHFELAPAYHVQVLADLLDIQGLADSADIGIRIPSLNSRVAAMRRFLGVLIGPDGHVVLLNDGYPVSSALLAVVLPTPWQGGSVLLPHAGIARLAAGPWTVFVDVGDPCPDELPAHAHADTLSCIVYFGGLRVVAEAYTSVYAPGSLRSFERSTAAHSTVEVGGENSTEVWGAFRAGRRARVREVAFEDSGQAGAQISAWHDGYDHLPGRPRHHRAVAVSHGAVTVSDSITSGKPKGFVLRWHTPSAERCMGDEIRFSVAGAVELRMWGNIDASTAPEQIATGFEATVSSTAIRAEGLVSGRVTVVTRIEALESPVEPKGMVRES